MHVNKTSTSKSALIWAFSRATVEMNSSEHMHVYVK